MSKEEIVVEETIRKFDTSTMKPDAVVFVIGKRGTGKSTLIRDIIYHNKHKFNAAMGMSPTEVMTHDLARFIPPSCLYDSFSETALQRLLNHQRRIGNKKDMRSVCLIMDDCAYDRAVFKKKPFRETIMNGRHSKLFVINAVQYMLDVPPDTRCNIDYVFATRENIIDNQVKLWKYFFGVFSDFQSFSNTLKECTKGFDCIVMDATSRSGELTDSVFWYTADDSLPEFRLGDDVFWELDRKYHREQVIEDDEGPSVRRISKKSNE